MIPSVYCKYASLYKDINLDYKVKGQVNSKPIGKQDNGLCEQLKDEDTRQNKASLWHNRNRKPK